MILGSVSSHLGAHSSPESIFPSPPTGVLPCCFHRAAKSKGFSSQARCSAAGHLGSGCVPSDPDFTDILGAAATRHCSCSHGGQPALPQAIVLVSQAPQGPEDRAKCASPHQADPARQQVYTQVLKPPRSNKGFGGTQVAFCLLGRWREGMTGRPVPMHCQAPAERAGSRHIPITRTQVGWRRLVMPFPNTNPRRLAQLLRCVTG